MNKESYHHDNLKELLIDEGLKLYTDIGYESFSMRKVAKNCSVSHNAPYRHFKDKDDLISHIMRKAVSEFEQVLQLAIIHNENNPIDQLKRLGLNYIDFFYEKPSYVELFFGKATKGVIYVSNDTYHYGETYLFRIIVECIQDLKVKTSCEIDVDLVAIEFWSMIHGLTIFIVTQKIEFSEGYKSYAHRIIDRMLKGIGCQ